MLLNFAPYGDNDIYYHPPIDRFDGVEVMKGADLTKYGPQTISGAINYLSPNPPDKPGGFVSFTGGNRDYLNGHVGFGGNFGKVGGLIDYLHKEGNAARDNSVVKLDDAYIKGIAKLNESNALTLRGDYYREDSQSTFGITDAELRNFGYRYNPFKYDTYSTRRWSATATHEFRPNADIDVSTSFYWSQFQRDFWRQNNQQPTDINCGLQFREDRLDGKMVNVEDCRFTRGRLRDYNAWGIETRMRGNHRLFGTDNRIEAGFRAHYESQRRLTQDGDYATARSGRTIEDNGRYADAYAGFIRNRFTLGRWFVTPGLRIESISYVRKNLLSAGVAKGNGNVSEPLPSFAVGYKAFEWANLFFDLHKGFSPPRVEDSIYNNGMSTEIASEQSWNFELGVRSRPWIGVQTDIVGFHNSFDNLTAVGTVGGNDTPVAQGKALFEGLEFQNRIDFGELFDSGHNPYLSISYSWIGKAEAATAFRCLPLSDGSIPLTCPGGFVHGSSAGKRLPYSPEHLLVAKLGYSYPALSKYY